MGDLGKQLASFKQQIETQLQDENFAQLSQNMAATINSNYLKSILYYVQKISDKQLASYLIGTGKMYLRSNTRQMFSFYIGRNFEGDFQLILTPNCKGPDGKSDQNKNTKSGAYKTVKKAPLLNLLTGQSIPFYKLSITESVSQIDPKLDAEAVFSNTVNSPYVIRYWASAKYHKRGSDTGPQKVALFAPVAEQGNLENLIDKKTDLNIIQKFKMIYAIIAGLRHIHNSIHPENNVRSRDVKDQNMVVHANGLLQHIDFGGWQADDWAARTLTFYPPEFLEANARGEKALLFDCYQEITSRSFWYATPKEERALWNTRFSGAKGDIWGAGLSIYHLLFSKMPDCKCIEGLNTDLNYLKYMLQADPDKRATADSTLNLFIQSFVNTLKQPDLIELVKQISLYYVNDFHRMQFFSELHTAGCGHLIHYLPEEKSRLMDYQLLLDWPQMISVNEWARIREFYKLRLNADALNQFDNKLINRPEFNDELIGRSIEHAKKMGENFSFKLKC